MATSCRSRSATRCPQPGPPGPPGTRTRTAARPAGRTGCFPCLNIATDASLLYAKLDGDAGLLKNFSLHRVARPSSVQVSGRLGFDLFYYLFETVYKC
jgi:hypothetical protein